MEQLSDIILYLSYLIVTSLQNGNSCSPTYSSPPQPQLFLESKMTKEYSVVLDNFADLSEDLNMEIHLILQFGFQ